MPVRTKEQAAATKAMGDQLDEVLLTLWCLIPNNILTVRHPEMLEEIHWDLTQIKSRVRLAVTGEYDAV